MVFYVRCVVNLSRVLYVSLMAVGGSVGDIWFEGDGCLGRAGRVGFEHEVRGNGKIRKEASSCSVWSVAISHV